MWVTFARNARIKDKNCRYFTMTQRSISRRKDISKLKQRQEIGAFYCNKGFDGYNGKSSLKVNQELGMP